MKNAPPYTQLIKEIELLKAAFSALKDFLYHDLSRQIINLEHEIYLQRTALTVIITKNSDIMERRATCFTKIKSNRKMPGGIEGKTVRSLDCDQIQYVLGLHRQKRNES